MEKTQEKKRLIIGMSGASGAILGITILKILKEDPRWESHLIISKGAEKTISDETTWSVEAVKALADRVYSFQDIGAGLASGTYRTEGMIVVPCSMKTVGGIASGYSDNLLLRAADVTLKEGRRLVLVARETPLNTIHLRNLLTVAEAGAMVIPPMITYYNKPETLEDINLHIIGKILDKFGISLINFRRWGEGEQMGKEEK